MSALIVGSLAGRGTQALILATSLILVFASFAMATTDVPMPNLAGSWAMIQFMPEAGNLPLIGEATITALVCVFVRVEQAGEQLTMHDTYCKTEVLSSNWLLTSDVPDLAIASFDPPTRMGRLVYSDDGWRLEQDWHIEIRGAVLEEPETDELPTSVEDPRIIDSDGDGAPGFTIPVLALGIIGGDTYVVQRLRYRVIGTSVGEDRIEGPLDWTSEQNVVGATDGFLMTGFEQWHDPNPDVHRFFMVRLGEGSGCQDAVAVLEAIVLAQSEP